MPIKFDPNRLRTIDYSFSTPVEEESGPETSALGAFGRGAVRGAAPAAVGLAAAAPGATTGAAMGAPLGPLGAGAGALIGGLATGLPAAYAASWGQEKLFDAAPEVARKLGQSREQRQADIEAHPYASMAGEVAPNLLAMRPSLSAFGRAGRATPEAAAAIRSTRANMGINAGLGGAQDAAMQAYEGDDIDWKQVALQAGMAGLGGKETALGRKLSSTSNLLPESVRARAELYLKPPRQPVPDDAPTDILKRTPDNVARDSEGNQLQIEDQRRLVGDSAGRVGDPNSPEWQDRSPIAGETYSDQMGQRASVDNLLADNARTRALPAPDAPAGSLPPPPDFRVDSNGNVGRSLDLRNEAWQGAPEGAQGELFNVVPKAPTAEEAFGIQSRMDEGGQQPTQLPDAEQPTLFDANPTATLKSDFGPKEILTRLRGAVGRVADPKKGQAGTSMDTMSPRDPFVYKVFTEITRRIGDDNVPALRGFIIDQRQNLETAPLKSKTLDDRLAVLEAAEKIADEYDTRAMSGFADEGAAKSTGGVTVDKTTPVDDAASVEAVREQNGSTDDIRTELLTKAMTTEGIRDPVKYFEAQLKRNNLDAKLTDEEFDQLYRRAEEVEATGEEMMRRAADNGTESIEANIPDADRRAKTLEYDRLFNSKQSPEPLPQADAAPAGDITPVKETAPIKPLKAEKPQVAAEPPTPANGDDVMKRAAPEAVKAAGSKHASNFLMGVMHEAGISPMSKEQITEQLGGPSTQARRAFNKGREWAVADKGRQVAEEIDVKKNSPESAPEPKESPAPVSEPEAPKLTYEDVLKEADSYLAEDGESGLLKPVEYQRLSKLADDGNVEPEHLKEMLDKIVDDRSQRAIEMGRKFRSDKANSLVQRFLRAAQQLTGKKEEFEGQALRDVLTDRDLLSRMTPNQRELSRAILQGVDGDVVALIDKDVFDWSEFGISGQAGFSNFEPAEIYLRGVKTPEQIRTLLHEAAHVALISRYDLGFGGIARGEPSLAHLRPALKSLMDAYNQMSRIPGKWAHYGMKNIDEFAAEALVNPKFQKFLREGNIWTKFVDFVRRMFKLPPSFEPQLTKALDSLGAMLNSTNDLPRRGTYEDPTGTGVRANVSSNIERLPESLRAPVRAIADIFSGQGTRAVSATVLGPKLTEMAHRAGLTEATNYQSHVNQRDALVTRYEAKAVKVAEDYDNLPAAVRGRGGDTVNGLAKQMVMAGEWAFQPKWLKDSNGNQIEVTINPELAEKYNQLGAKGGKEAQRVFEQLFELPHQMIHEKRKMITEMIDREHGAIMKQTQQQIDAAAKAGDKAKVEKLAKELEAQKKRQKSDMRQFHKLFEVDLSKPYAPIRRFGDHVVVARSKEYVEAEELARATGDFSKVEEMKADPDHYFVDFAETNAGAERMRRQLEADWGAGNVEKFTKDKAREQLLGGRDMFFAFQRLRNLLDQQAMPSDMKRQLQNQVTDMLLSTLSQTSSRKAEMARLKVAGGDFDMMRGLMQQTKADAQFLGAIYKNSDITESLYKLSDQVKYPDGKTRDTTGREDRQSIANEIFARHAMSLSPPPPNTLADKLTSMTGLWMIGTSPSFILQQVMQPAVMSVPVSGAKHGYFKAWSAMTEGYKAVSEAFKGVGLTDQLNLDKVPEQWRSLAYFLEDQNALDVGINKELRSWTSEGEGKISDAMRNVMQKLSAITRKTEAINRLSTAVMQYKLELESGKPVEKLYGDGAYTAFRKDWQAARPGAKVPTEQEFAAFHHALKVVNDTHGNYDITAAPRFMRGPWARVITQFKKFQIMQLQLYGQALQDGFLSESVSPQERAIARKTLAFLTGHAAVVAGGLGLPAVGTLQMIYNKLTETDEERGDMERDLREAIGDPVMADLILHGAPSLAGLNLTNSLGQANMLQLAPYADTPVDEQSYNAFITQMMGPAIGGVGRNMVEAVDLASQGDYYKALTKAMPKGIAGAMQAANLAVNGETDKRGDVTAEDIGPGEIAATALSLNSLDKSHRQFGRGQYFEDKEFYDSKTADIKRDYVEAYEAGDQEELRIIRKRWNALQDARVKNGFKRQPMSKLLTAPREQLKREKNVVGGVKYGRSEQGYAENLAELTGEE